MATLWQQVLALDARYNAYRVPDNPQFRTVYMRRRSHLLRENAATPERNAGVRRDYLKLRHQLLTERYGAANISEQGSIKSRAASLSSLRIRNSKSGDGRGKLTVTRRPLQAEHLSSAFYDVERSFQANIAPTSSANASRALAGGKSVSENYAFSGMHHIFDQHKSAVVSVKFANDDKSRVACCSYDGTLSVMQLIPPPATIICVLRGHTSAVTDFVWSLSNDMILSSSLDGTARLWEVSSTNCIRSFGTLRGPEVLCCTFQPLNNNLFAIGKGNTEVHIMNVSTGKSVPGSPARASGRVLSLSYDASGRVLWATDDKGNIFAFLCDTLTGKVSSKYKKISVCPGHPITSICFRAWLSREARDPTVLINCGSGVIMLFRVAGSDGTLQFRRKFPIKQRGQLIRSSFCPLMSFRQGVCIVSGSEDMNVYFFDIERENKPCVNTLQGHGAPVLDVCFNYDESLLASCDANGTVIIWKRNDKI